MTQAWVFESLATGDWFNQTFLKVREADWQFYPSNHIIVSLGNQTPSVGTFQM